MNYDEFLLLSKNAVLDAIERGADWLELDSYISGEEYSKWRKQNELYIDHKDDDLSF